MTVAGLVQPDATLWPVPSYGDPDRQVVLDPPDSRQIRKNNDRAELQASDLQAVQSLTQLGDLDRQRTTWKPSRDLTAILIAGLSVLTVAAKMRQAIHSANIVATDCSPERIDGLSALPHIGRWVNLA